ncbi:anti-sigma factor [Winogradskyella flava]|uniref:Regulator of SigK n=1 Tax=Winogradskyella flava TaxID=1884876 RepID=A0A842IUN3_9FLAO|nr:anti-sigma factor [Winogradskyella flava]MBC2845614.1 anti-sigma factor [Winogradskyella flava]
MMDKKMLLENGLLAQYVLGELNAKDREQIEQLLASDAELKAHFDQLEADFEQLGQDNAIAPPAAVKSQLLDAIKSSASNDTKVVHLQPKNNTKWYLGIAASIAAFLLAGSFWMYNQLNDVKQQLQTVESNNTELNTTIEVLNKELQDTNTFYTAIVNPDTEQYILKGNDLLPEAKVVSYVNHKTKSVVINTERLPKLDADHDYQMWADVEGEMINMGVISKDKNLMTMAYIDHAESLNITIEPAGGNDHPTVEKLVTNVYIN